MKGDIEEEEKEKGRRKWGSRRGGWGMDDEEMVRRQGQGRIWVRSESRSRSRSRSRI